MNNQFAARQSVAWLFDTLLSIARVFVNPLVVTSLIVTPIVIPI